MKKNLKRSQIWKKPNLHYKLFGTKNKWACVPTDVRSKLRNKLS